MINMIEVSMEIIQLSYKLLTHAKTTADVQRLLTTHVMEKDPILGCAKENIFVIQMMDPVFTR